MRTTKSFQVDIASPTCRGSVASRYLHSPPFPALRFFWALRQFCSAYHPGACLIFLEKKAWATIGAVENTAPTFDRLVSRGPSSSPPRLTGKMHAVDMQILYRDPTNLSNCPFHVASASLRSIFMAPTRLCHCPGIPSADKVHKHPRQSILPPESWLSLSEPHVHNQSSFGLGNVHLHQNHCCIQRWVQVVNQTEVPPAPTVG